ERGHLRAQIAYEASDGRSEHSELLFELAREYALLATCVAERGGHSWTLGVSGAHRRRVLPPAGRPTRRRPASGRIARADPRAPRRLPTARGAAGRPCSPGTPRLQLLPGNAGARRRSAAPGAPRTSTAACK